MDKFSKSSKNEQRFFFLLGSPFQYLSEIISLNLHHLISRHWLLGTWKKANSVIKKGEKKTVKSNPMLEAPLAENTGNQCY